MESMAVQELSSGSQCRNPFCGAPLANAFMRFCESERRCQLYRCLELSAQALRQQKNETTSAGSTTLESEQAAFVIPKRKIQPVALGSTAEPAHAPTAKPVLSRKRPLPVNKEADGTLKKPHLEATSAIVDAAAPPSKVRVSYEEAMSMIHNTIREQVALQMRTDLAHQAAQTKPTPSNNATLMSNPPRGPKMALYDISGFEDASLFNLETFQDLFWRCRERMNKPRNVPEFRLAQSWRAFARDWNKDRLLHWFGPAELSRMRMKVHFECRKRNVQVCQVQLLEPGKCRGCGPTAPKDNLPPQQRARVQETCFKTPTCEYYLRLWTMQQLRLQQAQIR